MGKDDGGRLEKIVDEINILLQEATDHQLRLIKQVIRGLLKD